MHGLKALFPSAVRTRSWQYASPITICWNIQRASRSDSRPADRPCRWRRRSPPAAYSITIASDCSGGGCATHVMIAGWWGSCGRRVWAGTAWWAGRSLLAGGSASLAGGTGRHCRTAKRPPKRLLDPSIFRAAAASMACILRRTRSISQQATPQQNTAVQQRPVWPGSRAASG
jgi:hypothetical protein